MFKLPELDFSKATFLAPETIQYHYGKHHQAYIDNLNKLTKDLPPKALEAIIQSSEGGLYNNAAQTWNHTFYWLGLIPTPAPLTASSALSKSIVETFGSEAGLKTAFIDSATKVFGSGWTWLALNLQSKKLEILNTANAEMVDLKKHVPLLVCDVWEHAYYIEYRNSRPNYLAAFWNAINWKFVETNFETKDVGQVSKLLTV